MGKHGPRGLRPSYMRVAEALEKFRLDALNDHRAEAWRKVIQIDDFRSGADAEPVCLVDLSNRRVESHKRNLKDPNTMENASRSLSKYCREPRRAINQRA